MISSFGAGARNYRIQRHQCTVLDTAEKLIDRVYNFIGKLGLPQRLRDVGVQENQIIHLARLALQSRAVRNNPKEITSADQVEIVLRAAW